MYSPFKNHWYEPVRDINDCLSVLRSAAAHFATRSVRGQQIIKDQRWMLLSTREWTIFLPSRKCNATYLTHMSQVAQMAKATHLAQMSRFLPIQDNQVMLKSNGAGAVSQLITEHCNVDLAKMDGTIPLLNLCPCLCTIHPIKYRCLCLSRMSILGNSVLFVHNSNMFHVSCVSPIRT